MTDWGSSYMVRYLYGTNGTIWDSGTVAWETETDSGIFDNLGDGKYGTYVPHGSFVVIKAGTTVSSIEDIGTFFWGLTNHDLDGHNSTLSWDNINPVATLGQGATFTEDDAFIKFLGAGDHKIHFHSDAEIIATVSSNSIIKFGKIYASGNASASGDMFATTLCIDWLQALDYVSAADRGRIDFRVGTIAGLQVQQMYFSNASATFATVYVTGYSDNEDLKCTTATIGTIVDDTGSVIYKNGILYAPTQVQINSNQSLQSHAIHFNDIFTDSSGTFRQNSYGTIKCSDTQHPAYAYAPVVLHGGNATFQLHAKSYQYTTSNGGYGTVRLYIDGTDAGSYAGTVFSGSGGDEQKLVEWVWTNDWTETNFIFATIETEIGGGALTAEVVGACLSSYRFGD